MKSMKKTIALVVAIALLVGGAVGGTLAWLVANSGPVTNTFTTSNIEITLDESDNLDLKMIPGHTITKDPWVKVESGSEYCWLFVEVKESANFDSYMTWAPDTNIWSVFAEETTNADGTKSTILSCEIDTADEINTALNILENSKVTVLGSVTKADMETAATNQPTLTFTAYASQLYATNDTTAENGGKFTAAQAWTNAQPTNQ